MMGHFMSMTGYTKLFASIVTSTVWREPDHVRLVWVTMLALADKYGVVEASVPGLADMARVDVKQCREALRRLMEPDEDSRTQEYNGCRIEAVDGGWRLLNHAKYRHKMSADERREYDRIRKAEQRRAKVSHDVPDLSQPVPDKSTESTQAEAEADTDKIKPSCRAPRSSPAEPTSFAQFWAVYPNRKGKQAALRAWTRLNPDADLIGVVASAF